MKNRLRQLIGTVVLLGMLTKPAVESPFLRPSDSVLFPPAALNAWVANFHPWLAARGIKTYGRQLNELSIFAVGGNSQGGLAPEKEFINTAVNILRRQKKQPRVLITVANVTRDKMGDRRLLQQWIGTPERMKRHVQDLLKLAEKADGLDIDYENLYPADGPRFSRFILHLAQGLHARGKFLSVTVEPNALLYGSIHWGDLATRVDRIRVMAYPFHYPRTNPGAISPPYIVRNLAARALCAIPPHKLEIALPIYGYDWSMKGARLVATIEQYRELTRRPGARAFRDPETRCARVEYSVKEGIGKWRRTVEHHVWFEDPVSAAHKVQMLRKMGIYQIGLWQIGVGDISEIFELVNVDPFSIS